MSENEDGLPKEFEPTQRKLDEARKKGDVAKSADLTTAAGYGGFLATILSVGAVTMTDLGTVLSMPLVDAVQMADGIFGTKGLAARGHPLVRTLSLNTAWLLLPWFLIPMACAIIALLAQQSFVFAPSKLAPKGSRISPLSNMKQKFGRSGLFEFAKSAVKLTIYCAILGIYLFIQLPRILDTIRLSAGNVAAEMGRLTAGMLGIIVVVALSIGLVDFIWQKAEHIRKNRMSRKEMLDEMKSSEGDPQMKGRRRQRAADIAMNQTLQDVPDANVVIVNPTHYAVALKWSRQSGTAPICVSKGVDEVARRIREIAAENGVPIHSDPPTARAIFADVGIGKEIRSEHYRAVAAAIRFADTLRHKRRS